MPLLGSGLLRSGNLNVSNVLALLRYNGNFNDVKGNTVTQVGSPTINTLNPKFGSGAGEFNSNNYLEIATSDFVFPGDFTLETWLYLSSLPSVGNSYVVFWTATTDTDGRVQFSIDSDGKVLVEEYLIGTRILTTNSVPTSQWVHLAFSRNSGTLRAFIDGVLAGTANDFNTTVGSGEGIRIAGFSDSSNSLNGLLDETRITQSLGRYTASFTPSNSEFPDS